MESSKTKLTRWLKIDFIGWFSVFCTIVTGGVWVATGISNMKTAQAEQIKDTYYQGRKIDDLIESRRVDKIEYMAKIDDVQKEQKEILKEIRNLGK